MKKTWMVILLMHLGASLMAQEWIKYFTTGSYSSYCIENYDKGYVLAGSVNYGKYGWVIKTDVNGNKLWDIKIGNGVNETKVKNIEHMNDHGYILCGTTRIFNYPHSDPYIMKLNECGELEWCKGIVYDNAGDGAISVKPTSDGGCVLTALFYGNNPDDLIRMFKFDSAGELIWYRIFNEDPNVISEVIQTMYADDSNFLLTGYCYYPNWIKPYYIKTDTSGNVDWTLAYSQYTGLGFVGEASTSIKDIHGNYYSAGRRDGNPELLKLSANGNEMMNVDLINGAFSGIAVTLLYFNDTTFIIGAGWTMNGTDHELAIIKTDTLGNIKVQKYLPDPNHNGISWTSKTFDNKIITIGDSYSNGSYRIALYKVNSNLEYDSIYTRPFTYDSLCPDTIVSHTIGLNCDVLVGMDEPLTNRETTTLKIFPNPANQNLTVEFPKSLVVKDSNTGFGTTTVYHQWKSAVIEVYDLAGRQVFVKEIFQAQPVMEINVTTWPRGMYNFRLMYHNQTVASEKVVVR